MDEEFDIDSQRLEASLATLPEVEKDRLREIMEKVDSLLERLKSLREDETPAAAAYNLLVADQVDGEVGELMDDLEDSLWDEDGYERDDVAYAYEAAHRLAYEVHNYAYMVGVGTRPILKRYTNH